MPDRYSGNHPKSASLSETIGFFAGQGTLLLHEPLEDDTQFLPNLRADQILKLMETRSEPEKTCSPGEDWG